MGLDEKYIIDKVTEYYQFAADKYNLEFQKIVVKCDLKGTASGICRCYPDGEILLRFNIEICKLNREKFYEVIIHEISHSIVYNKFYKCKPHGKEWKKVVLEMGGVPNRCHRYNMPASNKRPFEVECNCDSHFVTKTIYNRIVCGQIYRCRDCKAILKKKSYGGIE